MSKQIIYIIMLTLLYSCVDRFEVATEEGEPILHVDGLLTTQADQSRVRLRYTARYGGVFEGVNNPVVNATVGIRNENGEVTFLTERIDSAYAPQYFDRFLNQWIINENFKNTGLYIAPAGFVAEIGKAYTLLVTLPNGERYTSLPEVANQSPPISDIEVQPYKTPTTNPLYDNYGLRLFAAFDDPPGERNNYLWTGDQGVFEIIANPELFLNRPDHPTCPKCPNPKPCCRVCFGDDFTLARNFEVSNDEFFNGLSTTQNVLNLSNDGLKFKGRYRFRLNQFSISDRAYHYFKTMKLQLSISGSVFDPPPANIRGNMINLSNPEKQVLGYFVVADVTSETLYIDGADIPLSLRPVPALIPDDCRTALAYRARIEPPENWEYN